MHRGLAGDIRGNGRAREDGADRAGHDDAAAFRRDHHFRRFFGKRPDRGEVVGNDAFKFRGFEFMVGFAVLNAGIVDSYVEMPVHLYSTLAISASTQYTADV